ncbi:sphingosine 1-phosphate receptor 2-like [Diadema setosum]|uniref:sphingosine 1-phosphate receptor 2-like n=1 Tax=Diadema setosum TaxID=31175 RepID=UPI003B3AA189
MDRNDTAPSGNIYFESTLLAICATAMLCNLLTLFAILGIPALRREQNIFTFNLALSDLVQAVSLIGQVANVQSGTVTPIIGDLQAPAIIMSIFSTLAIAFQRFVVIRLDPFGNRKIITATRSIAACVIVWFIVLFGYIAIPELIETNADLVSFEIVPVASVTFVFLLFTTLCYVVIYQQVEKVSLQVELPSDVKARRADQNRKILLTFGLVVGTTFVAWAMFPCVLLMVFVAPHLASKYFRPLVDASLILLALNLVVNPTIYWFRLVEFRQQLLRCFRKRGERGGSVLHKTSRDHTRKNQAASVTETTAVGRSLDIANNI